MRFSIDGRPGDQRGFIHKKILGGISKIAGILPIPGAEIVSAITGRLAGTAGAKELGKQLKLGTEPRATTTVRTLRPRGDGPRGDDCPRGFRPDFRTGRCEPAAGQEVGEAVMGRYGAALVPGVMVIDRSVCLRGMQLGNDGLCYNKSQISNKQRMWPRGRRPLLTGGDMRAIGIASRAGTKLERTTKRLRSLGMMKPLPKGSGGRAHAHARPVAAVSAQQ